MNIEYIKTIAEIFIAIGAIAFAIGQFWGGRHREMSKDTASTIATLREELAATRELAQNNKADLENERQLRHAENKGNAEKIGVMQGQLQERDKTITDYKEILAGRDQATQKILELTNNTNNNVVTLVGLLEQHFDKIEKRTNA